MSTHTAAIFDHYYWKRGVAKIFQHSPDWSANTISTQFAIVLRLQSVQFGKNCYGINVLQVNLLLP